jgi:hypothetical protein
MKNSEKRVFKSDSDSDIKVKNTDQLCCIVLVWCREELFLFRNKLYLGTVVTLIRIATPRLVKPLMTTLTFFTKMLDYVLNVLIFMTVFVPMSLKLYIIYH